MAASGTITVNFGAFPGASDASVAVTGQAGILSGSVVGAWVTPVATADHTADEHAVEGILVTAGSVSAGTGFTITAIESVPDGGANEGHRLYGQYTVAWAWA